MEREASDLLDPIGENAYAPNLFVIRLNPQNAAELSHVRDVLPRDLSRNFTAQAARQNWRLAKPVRVELRSDDAVHAGAVDVLAWSDPFTKTLIPPPSKMMLRISVGNHTIAEAPLADRITVGTGSSCSVRLGREVQLDDGRSFISRTHVTIRKTEHGYELVDGDGASVRSTNGTFLNGARIRSPIHVHPGLRIVLGPVRTGGAPDQGAATLQILEFAPSENARA